MTRRGRETSTAAAASCQQGLPPCLQGRHHHRQPGHCPYSSPPQSGSQLLVSSWVAPHQRSHRTLRPSQSNRRAHRPLLSRVLQPQEGRGKTQVDSDVPTSSRRSTRHRALPGDVAARWSETVGAGEEDEVSSRLLGEKISRGGSCSQMGCQRSVGAADRDRGMRWSSR